MIRTVLLKGVVLWGLPAGALCGLFVSWFSDRPLLQTLGISLPVFAVMGLFFDLGRWARRNTGARLTMDSGARAQVRPPGRPHASTTPAIMDSAIATDSRTMDWVAGPASTSSTVAPGRTTHEVPRSPVATPDSQRNKRSGSERSRCHRRSSSGRSDSPSGSRSMASPGAASTRSNSNAATPTTVALHRPQTRSMTHAVRAAGRELAGRGPGAAGTVSGGSSRLPR